MAHKWCSSTLFEVVFLYCQVLSSVASCMRGQRCKRPMCVDVLSWSEGGGHDKNDTS